MPRIEKILEDDKRIVLRALVTPFGDPTRKDFSGEFFHAGTDFGDDIGVKEKIAFYEHSVNSLANPHKPPAVKAILGKATLAKIDKDGRWYDFELDRINNEYTPFVMDLFQNGWLGASSQAFFGTKVMNAKVAGQIDQWIEAEPSLTPTPDNPATIFTEDEIMKIQNSMKTFAPRLYKAAYGTVPVQVSDKKEGDATGSFADEIDKFLDGEPEKEEEKSEEKTDTTVTDTAVVTELRTELAAVKQENAGLRTQLDAQVEAVKTLTKTVGDLVKDVAEVKTATIKTAQKLGTIQGKRKVMSDAELAANDLPAKTKDKPASDAPSGPTYPVNEHGFRIAFGGKGPGSKAQ